MLRRARTAEQPLVAHLAGPFGLGLAVTGAALGGPSLAVAAAAFIGALT